MDVIFVAPLDSDRTGKMIQILHGLRRDDYRVASREQTGQSFLWIEDPPVYLLDRAREEELEGVRVFEHRRGGWFEDGASRDKPKLKPRDGEFLFFSRDGAKETLADLEFREPFDALIPSESSFANRPLDIVPISGPLPKFSLNLRLVHREPVDPSLWLLRGASAEVCLETLIESFTSEELERALVSKLTAEGEPVVYLVMEKTTEGKSRLSVRISDLTGEPGFYKVEGGDNLYLPHNRGFNYRVRRDCLRETFALDDYDLVVVTEGKVTGLIVKPHQTVSLLSWVEYSVGTRNLTLEDPQEVCVFDWSPIAIQEAEKVEKEAPRVTETKPKKAAPERKKPRQTSTGDSVAEIETNQDDGLQAVRDEIENLESVLCVPGNQDAAQWLRLSDLKKIMHEDGDATLCAEIAAFLSSDPKTAADCLASLHSLDGNIITTDDRSQWNRCAASAFYALACGETLSPEAALFTERSVTESQSNVSRYLAWATLRHMYKANRDKLGFTRAKERFLGGINQHGLSEFNDLPRFVRRSLVLSGNDGSVNEALNRALLSLYADAEKAVNPSDSLSEYVRLAFAVGMARLGNMPVAKEMSSFDKKKDDVNAVLQALYRGRIEHEAAGSSQDVWQTEITRITSGIKDARSRDRVAFLVKRSSWLKTDQVVQPTKLRPKIEDQIRKAGDADLPAVIRNATRNKSDCYDYEACVLVEIAINRSIESGNETFIRDCLEAATAVARESISIAGHKARALGHCIRAAAIVSDIQRVDGLLGEISSLANAPQKPFVRELLDAVRPALSAMRRLGATKSAVTFLDSMMPLTERKNQGGTQLLASLADGYLLASQPNTAKKAIEQAIEAILGEEMDGPERFASGVAVLEALRHWPIAERLEYVRRILIHIHKFTDSFTASMQKIYETHKILIAEAIVNTMADAMTWQSDKVQSWLDGEEMFLRRTVIDEWRSFLEG